MAIIEEFLQEVLLINWFGHSEKVSNEYHIIHSIFEAYDDWNELMLKTWEPQICSLENIAINKIGDEQIDEIFSIISSGIGNTLWVKWSNFITKWNLEEVGIENEILDMVKRDIS